MARRNGTQRLEGRRTRLERHAAETDPDVVLNAAARFLEVRARSVDEVRRHLTAAAFPPALIEAAIARLLELGMLDDRAFAKGWVESRDRARPRGAAALRRELAQKGIERETIAAVLAERADAVAEAGDDDAGSASPDELAAERLLAKSRSALARIDDPRARRQRAYALLARNGFDPDVCREISARLAAPQMPSED